MAAACPDDDVSGMLLYAKTGATLQPDDRFLMEGNAIYVRTLDLSVEFSDIEAQLNAIARLVS